MRNQHQPIKTDNISKLAATVLFIVFVTQNFLYSCITSWSLCVTANITTSASATTKEQ